MNHSQSVCEGTVNVPGLGVTIKSLLNGKSTAMMCHCIVSDCLHKRGERDVIFSFFFFNIMEWYSVWNCVSVCGRGRGTEAKDANAIGDGGSRYPESAQSDGCRRPF